MCNNNRRVYDPSEKAKELVGKMAAVLTVEEMQDLADLFDEGGDIELHDALIEKVIEKEPAKANEYVVTKLLSTNAMSVHRK